MRVTPHTSARRAFDGSPPNSLSRSVHATSSACRLSAFVMRMPCPLFAWSAYLSASIHSPSCTSAATVFRPPRFAASRRWKPSASQYVPAPSRNSTTGGNTVPPAISSAYSSTAVSLMLTRIWSPSVLIFEICISFAIFLPPCHVPFPKRELREAPPPSLPRRAGSVNHLAMPSCTALNSRCTPRASSWSGSFPSAAWSYRSNHFSSCFAPWYGSPSSEQ